MPGFTTTQVFRNLPAVLIKNVPFPMISPISIKFFFIYWAFVVYKLLRGEGLAALKGVVKSIALWPHAFKERKKKKKTKVATNAYIRSILYKGLPLRSVKRLRYFLRSSARCVQPAGRCAQRCAEPARRAGRMTHAMTQPTPATVAPDALLDVRHLCVDIRTPGGALRVVRDV